MTEYIDEQNVIEKEAIEEVKVIETALSEHPIIIDHLTCTICFKKFKKTYNLKQHLLIHTNDKPFKCDTCGKAFVQKSNLTKHHLTHKNTGYPRTNWTKLNSYFRQKTIHGVRNVITVC